MCESGTGREEPGTCRGAVEGVWVAGTPGNGRAEAGGQLCQAGITAEATLPHVLSWIHLLKARLMGVLLSCFTCLGAGRAKLPGRWARPLEGKEPLSCNGKRVQDLEMHVDQAGSWPSQEV